MAAVNKVILIGNLGRDPELRKTPSGAAVTSFSLATTEKFTDKQGQRQEQTEWHNIVAWNRSAETMAQYLRKGSSVYIEGKLKTQSWEDNGVKKYRTEIIVQQFQFIGGGNQGGGQQQGGFGGQQQQGGFGDSSMDQNQGFGGGDQFGGQQQNSGFGGGQQQGSGFGGEQGSFGGGQQGGGFGGDQGGFGGGSAPMPNTQAPQQQSAPAPQAPAAPAGLPVEDELPF